MPRLVTPSKARGSVPKHSQRVGRQWQDGSVARFVDGVRGNMGGHRKPIVITEDDGLCTWDGAMTWGQADAPFHRRHQSGPQGVDCYFHFDDCSPTRSTKCAFGQSVAAKASWGLFLSCCR